MVLILQCVPPIVSPPLTRPDDLGVTHGTSRQTDPRKPHHHCRFSRRSDLLSAAGRWQGVPRVYPRLCPVPWLPAQTQDDLLRRWMPDTAFAFNWLRVLDTAERPQIDQGIGHHLHPIVSLLDTFKAEQQPLELVF